MALTVGDKAPEFELRSHRGGTVKLSDFRGKRNVEVAFHSLTITPVCATQMTNYQTELPAFDAADTAVRGVCVDAQPAKSAWAKELGTIDFDLLSDFHPHGAVARQFGVLREDGISERAVFLVDKAGTITFAKVYAIPEQPPVADLLIAVRSVT